MEQNLADRSDGEELIDAKVGGVHSMVSRLQRSKVCLKRVIWDMPAVKFWPLNGSIDIHGTKYSRQRWWRGADRRQIWGCAFNGQPTTALPSMLLACDMGMCLLIMQYNSNFGTDRLTLMELSLADRGDRKELIDTKVGGVRSTYSQLQPSKLCL